MTGLIHCFPIRIYYEDTDHGGVVYYANYLKFMERARTEYLRGAGLEQDEIERKHGILFAVTEAHVRYHKPARFNDLLEIESSIREVSGVQIAMQQLIRRAESGELLVTGNVRLASMDRNGKPKRMPREIATFFQQHLNPTKENS